MGFPSLKRADTCETTTTDTSSLDYEKATTRHREFAPVEEVIKEEDEDNVGQAEYIKSTKQAEIVRRLFRRYLEAHSDSSIYDRPRPRTRPSFGGSISASSRCPSSFFHLVLSGYHDLMHCFCL